MMTCSQIVRARGWVGTQNGTAAAEGSLAVSYKTNILRQSGSPIAWYLPKGGENLYPHINPCMDVYTYFFQTWKQLKMSFSR